MFEYRAKLPAKRITVTGPPNVILLDSLGQAVHVGEVGIMLDAALESLKQAADVEYEVIECEPETILAHRVRGIAMVIGKERKKNAKA